MGGDMVAITIDAGNAGDGYYVNNKVTTPAAWSSDMTINVYSDGTTTPLFTTFTLPAGYACYAYSTGATSAEYFNEFVYDGSTRIGQLVKVGSGIKQIESVNGNMYLQVELLVEWTVTYSLNGGDGPAPSPVQVENGDTIPTAPAGTGSLPGWRTIDTEWYTRTEVSAGVYEYELFEFGTGGTPVTDNITLYLIWTNYDYTITGGSGSFTATKILHDGTIDVASGVGAQAAVGAIRNDAGGNDCSITFGSTEPFVTPATALDINTAGITFNGTGTPGWGEIELYGAIDSFNNTGTTSTITVTNATVKSYANVNYRSNGTGGSAFNNTNGTLHILGGAVQNNSGHVDSNAIVNNGTLYINGASCTVRSYSSDGVIRNDSLGQVYIQDGIVQGLLLI
jgi:hypothetical protein